MRPSTAHLLLHALVLALARCSAAAPQATCRMVIIGAGTPRTGSTHEMKLARMALRELGFGERFDDAGYWKWHEHVQMDEQQAAAHVEQEQRRWASWSNETVVLYKSHRYDPELLNLCSSFLVLLSHSGCLEATALSALNAGFITLDEDHLVSFLQGMFHELFLWRQHATVDLSSEELKQQPLHSAALVHHAIGTALGVEYRPLNAVSIRGEVSAESNPNIPHRTADEATKAVLRALMHKAKERLAYDTRVIGWKWLC